MPALALRILDANLNRAAEALRTIEDYARFALDDAAASADLKSIRHDLQAIRARLGPGELLAARDVAGDVGRDIRIDAEVQRSGLAAVAAAAFGRLGESLRSIAECAKTLPHGAALPAAEAAEQLRYRTYALEQVLVLRGDLRRRLRCSSLYVILTASLCRGDWLHTASEALAGGADVLQLREKALSDGELLRRAAALRELTIQRGALLIINDRPDIAVAAHADGVHVGQEDLPVAAVRRVAGGRLLVGVSSHDSNELANCLAQQPDYIAVGPMFASTTKPRPVAGPEFLRSSRGCCELPLVAIGGITAANAGVVREAGAHLICVCASVISSEDPRRSAAALRAALR